MCVCVRSGFRTIAERFKSMTMLTFTQRTDFGLQWIWLMIETNGIALFCSILFEGSKNISYSMLSAHFIVFFIFVGHWLGGDIEFVHWILVSVAMVVHKRWSHFSFVRIEMDFGICQYSVYLRHAMITIKDVVNIRLIRMLCDIAFHLSRNH